MARYIVTVIHNVTEKKVTWNYINEDQAIKKMAEINSNPVYRYEYRVER